MKIITVENLQKLIKRHGFDAYLRDLMKALKRDFSRWDTFTKIPRPGMQVTDGVIELMPICDNKLYYAYKYITCHPKNPMTGKLSIVGTGQLSRIDTGFPVMISEMTLQTALRTAATSALATDLMSRKNARVMAIIGTGAQSEFQVRALQLVRDIAEVRYFDLDTKAMDKFEKNLKGRSFVLTRCRDAEEAVKGADIVTVCTAARAHVSVLKNEWIKEGMHINGLGGDTAGKTELDSAILHRSRIVVEYFEQSFVEGEIQKLSKKQAEKQIAAHLYELVLGVKKGRTSARDITLFDSVGVALEDYSTLRLTYELAEKYGIGKDQNILPNLKDPKNLFAALA